MPRRTLAATVFLLILTGTTLQIAAQTVDSKLPSVLKWREIGPFRGGRSVAVSGVPGRPDEFYMGTCGGGLWKSTSSGVDWECVSDGYFKTGSVGAIAVSPSNPDIVYVGMGEACIRGNISHGDGVYKSTDGGKTWTHMGLSETRTIGRVRVNPTNPDIVYVAALGHVYGPNEERGVYKSVDGGKTWRSLLYAGDRAGAIDLCLDARNPDILYASIWEAWRTPYMLNSGGPKSGLFKSLDGGDTWTELTKNPGMPKGILGRIGVAVSPADSNRVYAAIEAEEGGIFRSDDGGATWERVNDSRNWRQRAWYYTHIYADPKNVDVVYVLNVGFGKSSDGGRTFTNLAPPHGDNHDLWIDPTDPNRMINANDGGANVSKDGGRTWTEQDFATAQFYHVSTDNAFPYRILGAQQDNSTVRIPSRVPGAGIRREDWTSTAGGESGYVAADPMDPDIVYGGSYGGYLERRNHRTNQSRAVDPWPDNPIGHGAIDSHMRFQWTYPIVFSPHNPKVLYACCQYVLKTTNGGQSWQKISPDLTRNDPKTLGPSGGPITKDNTGVEVYATIFTFAESPKQAGVMWAGSDDGLVHISRDGGKNWTNVTPKEMPAWGLCSIIEASAHSAGTAYLAVDNHENDDLEPHIFRTRDFGKSWEKITTGIPKTTFVRVVREDPKRKGLLYAGTETGVYASFNDGDEWEPLQLNLPVCPIHDLTVKQDDLIAATHGRSFWVLDDISRLRQLDVIARGEDVILLKPRDSYRARWGTAVGTTVGKNPLGDAVFTYYLARDTEKVEFEVTDARGDVVATVKEAEGKAGWHQVSTDLRYPSYRSVPGMIFWAAYPRPIGAPPGVYTVKLTVGNKSVTQTFNWLRDPRSEATDADLVEQAKFAREISARVTEANEAVLKIRNAKEKIDKAQESAMDLAPDAEQLKSKLTAIEGEIYQIKLKSGQDPLNYPIKVNNKLAALLGRVLSGDGRPTAQSYEVFRMLSATLSVHLQSLQKVLDTDLAAFNRKLRERNLEPVVPEVKKP